jgi:hypothetical protein
VGLATLPLAAISIADQIINAGSYTGSGLNSTSAIYSGTIFWVCASGWLVLMCVAGVLAARATGTIRAGAGAGIVAGLLSGLVYTVAGALFGGLLSPSTGSGICYKACLPAPPQPWFATVEEGIIYGTLIFGLLAVMFGAGCGLLGAVLGRWLHRPGRAHRTDPQNPI